MNLPVPSRKASAPSAPPTVPPPGLGYVLTFYVGADNVTGAGPSMDALAEALAGAGIKGATATPAGGVWQGKVERSAVVSIVLPDSECPAAGVFSEAWRVAEALRARFGQDVVLWTAAPTFLGSAVRGGA